jgi:alkylation response protein AidB-like acyl-CoA dehydrogenase
MDRDDLELFTTSVQAAVASADVDAALADLGWDEAYDAEPRAAVAVLFDALGRAGATSSAIHRVVGPALPGGLAFGRGEPVGGIDPTLGLGRVDGDAALTDEQVRLGRLALSHQLLGASRRMLELARAHALEREQFGQVIARFQAIRHRLAETLVAIEVAEAVVDEAWADGSADTAGMAKALAGRGARTAARHCQQVLAGIGFTTEHELHRHVRRVVVLDELLGSSRALTIELGARLLATRELPPQRPL